MTDFNALYNEWSSRWESFGILTEGMFKAVKEIGVYRLKLNGVTMYVGRAIEYSNGGLSKRLTDYIRESDSARKCGAGPQIYDNKDRLIVELIKVGKSESDVALVELLERMIIFELKPEWNVG